MRLLRLKIRNIASLRGEHEIDFMEIEKESSLFAITGETGSGKSTILNCLGLALYGQIYKKNVNQIDVVTLGEKDGSIELLFQVKDKYYLADWRGRVRKQNGELYSTPQTPTRNLYTLNGTDFSSDKTISNTTCAELLNLDFDQFCKCIILNQGEFAKFLTSSFNDRKDILEKLYPGEVLESMGRELKIELDSLQSKKSELEIKLGELRGDTFSGELLQEQKKRFEKELKTLEETSKHIETIDYHFTSLLSNHEKHLEKKKNKEEIQKNLSAETTKFNHLKTSGEAISEKYQTALKKQETERPVLEGYLKKEESLKLMLESEEKLAKRQGELTLKISEIEKKIESNLILEKSVQDKLSTLKKDFIHNLNDLKSSRSKFNDLFDIFSEQELMANEIKGKSEKLLDLENTGKELKASLTKLEESLKLIPADIKDQEKSFEKKKAELQEKLDQKQRLTIKSQELESQLKIMNEELKGLTLKLQETLQFIKKTEEDIFPLETTLKLQEVLNATEVCVDHAILEGKDHCPVCEQKVLPPRWKDLKENLSRTNLETIRSKYEDLQKKLVKAKNEEEVLTEKEKSDRLSITAKDKTLKDLAPALLEKLPTTTELDQELSEIKKKSWEFDNLKKESDAKNTEIVKVREQYIAYKNETSKLEAALSDKNQKLSNISSELKHIIPKVDRDSIRDLKHELKNLASYLEDEAKLDKLLQEKLHLNDQRENSLKEKNSLISDSQAQKIEALKLELQNGLKGEKASDLIAKMNLLVKQATDEWNKQIDDERKQENILRDFQGRLYNLDELLKEYDVHFANELHKIKELAALPHALARPESVSVFQTLKRLDLNLQSPRELFLPLKDFLHSEKEFFKNNTNECRVNLASTSTRLQEWEKIQDKIQLFELQSKDVQEDLNRKLRLYEVLGKDELRTFVLSLVEENLIHQTNEELQKLCQGRYEIVHQTRSLKMVPEFFIMDKFREGGRRKVSTLSGGETFMVSLAMALGLAEMTRGQAEIDSLFIDEGFGTLDEESLDDVLQMLQQIQTRGLMVGLISHIKPLTSSLPVNLVLNKKQDGTSSISLRFN